MTYTIQASAQGLYVVRDSAGTLVGRIINSNNTGNWRFRLEAKAGNAMYRGVACHHNSPRVLEIIAAEIAVQQAGE